MAVSNVFKNHQCTHCSLLCHAQKTDCICCTKCFNWYHLSCENVTKSDLRIFDKTPSKKFKCKLCLTKTHCHTCNCKYYPRSQRVNCINCSHSFCKKCIEWSGKNMKHFLSPENDFYCTECDGNFLCSKCEKPCEDLENSEPSIFCNCCHRWLHFQCSQLKVRQFNKLGRNSDSYYCPSCIGDSLPLSRISKKNFFEINNQRITKMIHANYALNAMLNVKYVLHARTNIAFVKNAQNTPFYMLKLSLLFKILRKVMNFFLST